MKFDSSMVFVLLATFVPLIELVYALYALMSEEIKLVQGTAK
jgi:hypothetical protein